LNEKQHEMNNKNYSNGHIITNIIASENPLLKQTDSHSSSYENKQITTNTENFNREQNHSRDSSPSATVNSNRSPSSTSGYTSSGVLRDSTSPPSAFVPQHDYLNVNYFDLEKNLYYLDLFRLDHQILMPSIDVHHHHLAKVKEHHQL